SLDRPGDPRQAGGTAGSGRGCSQGPLLKVVEVARLQIEVVRLQVAEVRRERVDAIVRHHHGLGGLELRGNAWRQGVIVMRRITLARRQRLSAGGGPPGQQRDVCVTARLRNRVVRLQTVATTAQLSGISCRELVAGREKHLRPEALKEGSPTLLARKGG